MLQRNNDHDKHNPGTEVQNSTTINVDNCPSSLISWRVDALLLFSGFCFWSSLGLNSWVLILFHCQLSTAQARINCIGPELHLTSFPATVGGLTQGTLLVWVLMVISLRSSEFRWKSSRYRNSPHSNLVSVLMGSEIPGHMCFLRISLWRSEGVRRIYQKDMNRLEWDKTLSDPVCLSHAGIGLWVRLYPHPSSLVFLEDSTEF